MILDAAYDSHNNYQLLSENNINPIIALNNRARINPVLTGKLTVSPDGKILGPTGCNLVYWGYCKTRNRHKFRCPAALNKCKCLFLNVCSKSNYGRTFYIHPTDELRLIGKIPR